MDLKLRDGDLALDSRGRPIVLRGVEELLQRAMIRLTARRGAFVCDPTLGSELYRLSGKSPAQMEQEALVLVQEALHPLQEVRVLGLTGSYDPARERYTCTVTLQVLGEGAALTLDL